MALKRMAGRALRGYGVDAKFFDNGEGWEEVVGRAVRRRAEGWKKGVRTPRSELCAYLDSRCALTLT